MKESKVEQILRRWQALDAIHAMWRGVWQELSDYILPRKNDVDRSFVQGRKRTDKLFDSTAVYSNEILASSMAGALTNQGMKWFSLKTRDEYLNEMRDIQVWLQDCAHRMHRAIQQSNFASEILEVYLDLGAIGTGGLLMEEKPMSMSNFFGGLQFRACNVAEFVCDEDGDGFVDTIFRKIPMTVRQIVMKFPDTASEAVKREADARPDTVHPVIHAVFPRRGARGEGAKNMPWASFYVDEKEKGLLREGGFMENPYAIARWTKASFEKYGRGPGHTALPDIKVLNKVKELSLKTWGKVLDPPMAIQHDGIVGTLRLTPGGINYTRGLPREVMEQMRIDARFDISQIKEEELRGSIRNIYWSNQLEMQQGPQMTAHEVMVRYEMMQRLLGPTLGRLETELLSPIVKRVFGIMFRKGALSEAPMALDDYVSQGGMIDIEYESPIARAQRSGDAVAVQSLMEFAGPFLEIRPDVLDNLDLDETIRLVADVRGVPAKILKSRDDVAMMRQQRAEQEAQQAQMQEMMQMSEVAKGMAPAMKASQEMSEEGEADIGWMPKQ